MIYPAFENSLSEGVLAAGTQRRFRAISAIAGKRLQDCLHHCSVLSSTDGDGSCMYLCISCSALSLIDIHFFAAGIVNISPRSIPNPVAFFKGGSRSSCSLSESNSSSCSAPGVMFIITMDLMANESESSTLRAFCVRWWISGRIAEVVAYHLSLCHLHCHILERLQCLQHSLQQPALCVFWEKIHLLHLNQGGTDGHLLLYYTLNHVMWSSIECPLLESAYVLAFQVLLALFGGCTQPVMTCKRMSPVESSEPQLFLLGVALILLSHTS